MKVFSLEDRAVFCTMVKARLTDWSEQTRTSRASFGGGHLSTQVTMAAQVERPKSASRNQGLQRFVAV